MTNIVQIESEFIEDNTCFSQLVEALREGFSDPRTIVPERHHHDFPNPKTDIDSTLLLMPAWDPGKHAGIKIVTISPENSQFDLPSVQGTYILLNAETGSIKATIEAKSLTAKRTAAASALASSYLSAKDASSMLMIGTGVLSTNLIQAHAAVRDIKKVYVWGRNYSKAKKVCESIESDTFSCQAVESVEQVISEVDIISCATLSKDPLVRGELLRPGQHLDLVGAYRVDMREADDNAITRGTIFVDTFHGGMKENGDIAIPLREKLIDENDIQAELSQLCSGERSGRTNDEQITIFKSVGYALEDLVAANYYYDQYETKFLA